MMILVKTFSVFLILIGVFVLLFKGEGNYQAVYDPAIPKQHVRSIDQTFLTYPEWFLVFSPDEYAQFVKTNYSHNFPYFTHIKQVWTAYYTIGQRIKPYPLNVGYHIMILTIATSTTIEYSFKAIYENIFGRLSSLWGRSPEDDFLAQVAQEYVDFIKITPWYDFDFFKKIPKLINLPTTSVRGLERKYMLLTEYAIKGVYGKIIGKLTHMGYELPVLKTAIHIKSQTNPYTDSGLNDVEVLSTQPDHTIVVLVPRYEAFKNYLKYIADKNYEVISIAGNVENISISWQVDNNQLNKIKNLLETEKVSILLTQKIVTQNKTRIVTEIPIHQINTVMPKIEKVAILEHVFDF